MRVLTIKVANKIATYIKNSERLVCGNSDFVIEFAFDAEWFAHDEKIARFVWGGKFYDVPFRGMTCPVPVVFDTDEIRVGVYAGDLCATTPAVIPCLKSVLCATDIPLDEDEHLYVSAALEAAEEAKEAAEETKQTADDLSDALDTVLAMQPKPYELIEEITLDEAVASFKRTLDTNGVAYNFSGLRVKVRTPAAAGANTTTQIIFNIGHTEGGSLIYHQLTGGLASTEKVSYLVAGDDHGMLDYYALTCSPSNINSRGMRDGYVIRPWRNIGSVQLSSYPATVLIPAGTTITIYGIRG